MTKHDHLQAILEEMFLEGEELDNKRTERHWDKVDYDYDKHRNLGDNDES